MGTSLDAVLYASSAICGVLLWGLLCVTCGLGKQPGFQHECVHVQAEGREEAERKGPCVCACRLVYVGNWRLVCVGTLCATRCRPGKPPAFLTMQWA